MHKINIKFTNITAEQEVRTYVEEKLAKIVKLIENPEEEILFRIEVGKTSEHHQSGDIYRAEMQVHARGADFRVEKRSQDVYSAIDGAQEELWREIENFKKKEITLLRRGGRAIKNLLRRFY